MGSSRAAWVSQWAVAAGVSTGRWQGWAPGVLSTVFLPDTLWLNASTQPDGGKPSPMPLSAGEILLTPLAATKLSLLHPREECELISLKRGLGM